MKATTKELIHTVAVNTGIPEVQAKKQVNAVMEALSQLIQENDKVTVTGMFSFTKKFVEEKTGFSAISGDKVEYTKPAHNRLSVKIGKNLNDIIQ